MNGIECRHKTKQKCTKTFLKNKLLDRKEADYITSQITRACTSPFGSVYILYPPKYRFWLCFIFFIKQLFNMFLPNLDYN